MRAVMISANKKTYRKDAIAFILSAIHLDIIVTPFLDELYDIRRLHEPSQQRIEGEYDLR
jgi:hypothetical protein